MQTGSLFTCTVFTRKPGIPLLNNKTWTCACASELCLFVCLCVCTSVCLHVSNSACTLTASLIHLGATSSVWSRTSCILPACLPMLGREVERGSSPDLRSSLRKQWRRASGDSGRQEQAQTQEPSILPVRQTCRALRIWRRNCLSLSPLLHYSLSLFLICPNKTKK